MASSTAVGKQGNFSQKDMYNLQMLSYLHWQNELAQVKLQQSTALQSADEPNHSSLSEKLQVEEEACFAVRDLTKFLTLFSEQSASARLLVKELQPTHLEHIARTVKAETSILDKIHGNGGVLKIDNLDFK